MSIEITLAVLAFSVVYLLLLVGYQGRNIKSLTKLTEAEAGLDRRREERREALERAKADAEYFRKAKERFDRNKAERAEGEGQR